MPQNPSTGKADRRPLSAEDVLEYRLKLAGEKGKGRARDSPDSDQQEAPSPSTHLVGLRTLNLDSGSSHETTPAHSPATLPQPTSPEHPAPAPLRAPSARTAAKKSSAGKSASEAPAAVPIRQWAGASQLLRPARRQASRSRSDASPASDGGSNGARISVLESRLNELEERLGNWADGFDARLKGLGV
jgi:hypothetical protein